MRKSGYTLIEILVALTISATALLASVYFGQQWWHRQQEEQFFADFQRDWAYLRQMAIEDGVTVNVKWYYQQQEFVFERISEPGQIHLPKPPWLQVDYDSYWQINWSGEPFTKIQGITFIRQNINHSVTFTWQLGSGVLLRNDK
jgi:prepilin-type N-terminal cleavage/methylation domain-containing protein